MSMKNSLTLAGIEPAAFRFIAQRLNHCTTLATSAACFCFSEMDEKLIELVRKCEVLYDVSNKKYWEIHKSLWNF
jgi:hypothetical protein